MTAACDRLADLATAVLGVARATSLDEVGDAVDGPLAAYVAAAESSGDERLADLARTYEREVAVYLAGGNGAGEAGVNADLALDRSAVRCIELGEPDDFPRQP